MFDIAFSELLVIAIVALLVIGPEKLPKVARTVGAFTGRMQRYVAQVKEEVNRETRFEELQKLQQEIKQSVEHESNATGLEHSSAGLRGSIHTPSGDAKIKMQTAIPKKPIKTITKPKSTATKPANIKTAKKAIS